MKKKQTNQQTKKNIKFRDWSVLNFILVFKVTTFDECTKVILKNWCASDKVIARFTSPCAKSSKIYVI